MNTTVQRRTWGRLGAEGRTGVFLAHVTVFHATNNKQVLTCQDGPWPRAGSEEAKGQTVSPLGHFYSSSRTIGTA